MGSQLMPSRYHALMGSSIITNQSELHYITTCGVFLSCSWCHVFPSVSWRKKITVHYSSFQTEHIHRIMKQSLSFSLSLTFSSSDGTTFQSELPPLPIHPLHQRSCCIGFPSWDELRVPSLFPMDKKSNVFFSSSPVMCLTFFFPRWVSEEEGRQEEGSHYCATCCKRPWDAAARRLRGRDPGSQTGRK